MTIITNKLTSTQQRLVQRTFGKIASQHQEFAQLYFDKLFELDTSLRRFFIGNLEEYQRKFMQMFALMIVSLDKPVALHEACAALAKHYEDSGIQRTHYSLIKSALQWSIQRQMGYITGSPLGIAWERAISLLVEHMVS